MNRFRYAIYWAWCAAHIPGYLVFLHWPGAWRNLWLTAQAGTWGYRMDYREWSYARAHKEAPDEAR